MFYQNETILISPAFAKIGDNNGGKLLERQTKTLKQHQGR